MATHPEAARTDVVLRGPCHQRHHRGRRTGRHGRPDRTAVIEEQEARRDLLKAEQDFRDALEEPGALGVQPLDAAQGVAPVPFVHDDQSAWYLFDRFDSRPIRSWRYQSDPEPTRRPLTAP
jgi:hypothetical protein